MVVAAVSTNEELARTEYARWFVREHFLRKRYDSFGTMRSLGRYRSLFETAQQNHGLKVSDLALYELWATEGFTDDYFVTLTDLEAEEPPERWTDDGRFELVHREYQWAKTLTEDCEITTWLLAEAEYNRVYHEALVRSYGVDVKTP